MDRLTIKNSDGTYSQPTHTTFEKMFYRVAELEDFLEEQGIKSLEDLKRIVENYKFVKGMVSNREIPLTKTLQFVSKLLEVIAYKHKWLDLKEFIEQLSNQTEIVSEDLYFIKTKIQELEEEF